MIVIICGVVAGVMFCYLFRVNTRGTPVISTIGWTMILYISIVIIGGAAIGSIFDSYALSAGATAPPDWLLFSKEVTELYLVPSIGGFLVGLLAYALYAERILFKTPALAVSVLFFSVIVLFFAATERQYGWFSRILKLSLASAELDLAPTGVVRVTPSSVQSSDPLFATGSAAVDDAMNFIQSIAPGMVIDRDFVKGVTGTDIAAHTQQDFRFMAEIVLPLVKGLQLIHKRRADSTIFDYFDRDTVNAVRSLANLQSDPKKFIDLSTLGKGLQTAWEKACAQALWVESAGGLATAMREKSLKSGEGNIAQNTN